MVFDRIISTSSSSSLVDESGGLQNVTVTHVLNRLIGSISPSFTSILTFPISGHCSVPDSGSSIPISNWIRLGFVPSTSSSVNFSNLSSTIGQSVPDCDSGKRPPVDLQFRSSPSHSQFVGVQFRSIGSFFFFSFSFFFSFFSFFFFFGQEAPGQPSLFFFFLGRRRIPSSSGCHFD